MKYNITYMSGAGNLFSVLDNTDELIDKNEGSRLATILCNKNEINDFETEGLMLLELSDDYSFKCSFFNPDGSTGMMCGNGGRAIVNFAISKNIIASEDLNINFEMAGSVYSAKIIGNLVDLEMPDINEERRIELKLQGRLVDAYYVDNGSQHTLINIKKLDLLSIDKLDINGLGREVRYNELFGAIGSNANFFDIVKNNIYLRTYERGVEKETGACGTGAVATAIAVNKEYGLEYPIEIVPTSGEKLVIDKRSSENRTKYHLIGPAVILKEKVIEV
jgi:diaminopimelate epimerase